MFTERVIIFIFTGIILIRGLSSYDKYGHDCTFKHEVHLNIWHYKFPATERKIQLGQITYHLKDTIRKLCEYLNLIQCGVECSKYVPIHMQIGQVKVLEIQMLDN